jgi:hypothetical protein
VAKIWYWILNKSPETSLDIRPESLEIHREILSCNLLVNRKKLESKRESVEEKIYKKFQSVAPIFRVCFDIQKKLGKNLCRHFDFVALKRNAKHTDHLVGENNKEKTFYLKFIF